MPTPVIRAGAGTFTTGASSLTLSVTKPSGAQTGDLLLIWPAMGANTITFSATGFTAVTAVQNSNGSQQLLYRTLDGTEGASFTVTASVSHPWCAATASLGNVDASLFDPTPTVSGQVNAVASTTISVPGITTTKDGDLLVWFGQVQAAAGNAVATITLPAGYTAPSGVVQATSTGTSTSNCGVLFGTFVQTTHGATGATNGTASTALAHNGGMLLAVPGTASPPPGGTPGLVGAFVDPAVYGLSNSAASQTTAVADFNAIVGRAIGVRRSAYGFRVIPRAYNTDTAASLGGGFSMVGSTTYNGSGYGTSDTLQRCRDYDAAVGRTMALQATKWYLKEGQNFTTAPADLKALNSAGILIYVCLKPSRTLSSSQQTALAGTLDAMEAAKINYKNILYQEANTNDFPSASAYQAYCQFYGPIVRNHSSKPIAYDPSSGSVAFDPSAFYPGDQWSDEILTDWYCSAFVSKSSSHLLDTLAGLADGHTTGSTSTTIGQNGNGTPSPAPFGIGEWGGSAAGTTPTLAQWVSYTNYMVTFFQGRVSAGKVNAPIIYFNDVSTASQPENFIASSSDFKIPQIQVAYDAINGPGTGV